MIKTKLTGAVHTVSREKRTRQNLEMNTSKKNVNELFAPINKYRVPLYQRHYVWDDKNWRDLWGNIKEKSDLRLDNKNGAKTHFTGAIVIQPADTDRQNLEIIDGQQRLTTFQIIFCTIRDICKEFDDDTDKIATRSQRFLKNMETSASVPAELYKLLPREGTDREAFRLLIKLEKVARKKNIENGPIYQAYVYFKALIEKYIAKDYGKLANLFTCISTDFIIVEIEVSSDDEPEKIFQTINGTGRALDEFDLLRNNLFLRARTGEKRDGFYTKYWCQFEEDLKFWHRPGVMDDFLAKFLRIKRGKDFDDQLSLFDQYQTYQGKLFDQYQTYQGKLADKLNLNETNLQLVEHEFRELKRCATIYQIHDPSSNLKISRKIKSRMEFYDEFNMANTLARFRWYITTEFGVSTDGLIRVFKLLESYAVRKMLCTHSAEPLEEVNELLLDLIDSEQSFSLAYLIYRLSKDWPKNQRVKTNLNQLPKMRRTRKRKAKSSSIHVWKFLVRRIFSRVGWDISEPELFKRFCEIWPSAEAMLQSEFKEGLPIVYSKLPILAEAKPQLEPYKFMTYNGLRELSKYEIREGTVTGTVPDSNGNGEVIWDMKEILFAFPVTAMTDLEPHINEICDDVKNTEIKLVQKQVKERLQLYVDNTENPNFNQRLLPDIAATAVTRAGHVLRGTVKSFNDDAIYMQINGQTVTVYMHGLYELNTTEMLLSVPHKFMTYDEVRELSKYEIREGKVTGTAPGSSGNGEVIWDMEEILFTFPAAAMTDLEPHINEICDDVKNTEIKPVQKQVKDWLQLYVDNTENPNFNQRFLPDIEVTAVTHAGHVLRGTLGRFSADAIYMRINGRRVTVYTHSLYELNTAAMLQSVPHKFMTYDGLRELSKYEIRENIVMGTDPSSNSNEKVVWQENIVIGTDPNSNSNEKVVEEILFDFPATVKSDSEPYKICDDVKNKGTVHIQHKQLQLSMDNKVDVTVVTHTGHTLRGKIKCFDNFKIEMQVAELTVNVYRHGLSHFSADREHA